MSIDRGLAESLACTCSDEKAIETLMRARIMVKDWKEKSSVNPGMSRGTFYNIVTAGITPANLVLHKKNIIWEFGEYMPDYEKIVSERNKNESHHEEPNELDLSGFIKRCPKIERIR